MKCEDCDCPASVHAVEISDGNAGRQIHLCRKCAELRTLIIADPQKTAEIKKKPSASAVGFANGTLAHAVCPDCGIGYMEFRKEGRLGCPYDFVAFREGILPLLDRIQRAVHHRGKRPRVHRVPIEAHDDLRSLRQALKWAIQAEEFEQAAQLRDRIRARECRHGA